MTDEKRRIGIDLGGTKIEGVVLDASGAVVLRERVATPKTASAIHAAVADVVHGFDRQLGAQCTVGVGTPGALSPRTGLLRNSNTVCLNGTALDRDLEAAIGRPIRMANDANCFALSEAVDGAGKGARLVLGLIVGTGTGAGIVFDRQVWTGPNAIAGEWGHNPLPWPEPSELPGAPCYCGKCGCIETWLSGPGLSRDHLAVNDEEVSAVELAARAVAGEKSAVATMDRHAHRFARSLASVINVLDPDVVVIGGGISQHTPLYPSLAAQLGKWVFSDHVTTPVVRAEHGDASGVRGAAWLWH
jgi:fructokinase